MSEFAVKRQFQSLLTTGVVAVAIFFVVALFYWLIWGMIVKAAGMALAGDGLKLAMPRS